MYNYNLTYDYPTATATAASAGIFAGIFGFFIFLIAIACVVLVFVAQWKIFKKAGKEGWKALIPIYNTYTMLQILSMEPMLCFLSFVPFANFMLSIVMSVKLAKSFGKTTGFAIGLILLGPIFQMILAFSDAKYKQLPSSK